jgi:hypothetical protein
MKWIVAAGILEYAGGFGEEQSGSGVGLLVGLWGVANERLVRLVNEPLSHQLAIYQSHTHLSWKKLEPL